MAHDSLVTVIITNYNYAEYIGLAIDSALGQSWNDIEVIVIDDGSSDESRGIIEERGRRDNRLRIYFQENSGQAAATNRGILEARGEYIAFLDADDLWYPHKLSQQLPLFEDPSIGVVYSAANIIDTNGKEYAFRPTRRLGKEENFLHSIVRENFIPFSSAVVRRDCFIKAGLLNSQYRVCTDYDLWLRLGKFYNFDAIEQPLIAYRARPDSLSGNPVEMFRVAREITEIFYMQNPQLFNQTFIRHERIAAYSTRVHVFSKEGHAVQALASLWQLFRVAPFSRQFVKSTLRLLSLPLSRSRRVSL